MGRLTRNGDRPRRVSRVRGATLVEYALGMSLVLSASMGAISSLQAEATEELENRGGSIGAPDVEEAAETTTTSAPSAGGPGGSTTTTAPPAPPDSTVASATSTSHTADNRWTATVVVSITANGQPVHKAALTAMWQMNPGGSITNVTCSTQRNGTCTFTLRNLGRFGSSSHVASVNFTLTSVTPQGGTTSNPGLTVTVYEP